MTELYREIVTIDGEEIEVRVEATAGYNLTTAERWFGSSVRYRYRGTLRWRRFHAVDVHPFDSDAIHAAIGVHLAERVGGAQTAQ